MISYTCEADMVSWPYTITQTKVPSHTTFSCLAITIRSLTTVLAHLYRAIGLQLEVSDIFCCFIWFHDLQRKLGPILCHCLYKARTLVILPNKGLNASLIKLVYNGVSPNFLYNIWYIFRLFPVESRKLFHLVKLKGINHVLSLSLR